MNGGLHGLSRYDNVRFLTEIKLRLDITTQSGIVRNQWASSR